MAGGAGAVRRIRGAAERYPLSSSHRVQRHSLERLRLSSPNMIQVLVQDVLRQHIERIEPATVADLFALEEADLPARLHGDLANWAARARREILDLPQTTRLTWVAEVADLPAEQVPTGMRDAILALGPSAPAELSAALEELKARWETLPPTPVKVATPSPRAAAEAAAPKPAKAPRAARAPRTPAALVDPRRAEWIRQDALARLGSREYAERGLKQSILLAGIQHRSPYKDLTLEEILQELRRMERERKLKHTGERWTVR